MNSTTHQSTTTVTSTDKLAATLHKLATNPSRILEAEMREFGLVLFTPISRNRIGHLLEVKCDTKSRHLYHSDDRVEEAISECVAELQKETGEQRLNGWQRANTILRETGNWSESAAYLRASGAHRLDAWRKNWTPFGYWYEAVATTVGNATGYHAQRTRDHRNVFAPIDGKRWPAAVIDLDIRALGKLAGEEVSLRGIAGPTHDIGDDLRALILPIIRAGFDLITQKMTKTQLTEVVIAALCLEGVRSKGVSLDAEQDEAGYDYRDAEVTEASTRLQDSEWSDRPITAELRRSATRLADCWEREVLQREGCPFAEAARVMRKGSDAPVMLYILSGATLAEAARAFRCGVSALQGRCAGRGWTPNTLGAQLREWRKSRRSRRERCPFDARLERLFGCLLKAPEREAMVAFGILRGRHSRIFQKMLAAA